jgi:hypothetical protein
MADREQVLEWVHWVRDNGMGDEPYPPVQTIKITGLWDAEAEEHGCGGDRQQTVATFMELLSASPNDFPTRFVAIHFYWSALKSAQAYNGEERMLFPHEIEQAISECEADLALVVRAVAVDDLTGGWDFVAWEISNAYLIGDWQRASALYNLAEHRELKRRPELQALRGQFKVLTLLGCEVDEALSKLSTKVDGFTLRGPHWIPPKIYLDGDRPVDELLALTLLQRLGVCHLRPAVTFDDWRREWMEDAATDLKRALSAMPQLPIAYQLIRARALYCAGLFREAAECYVGLLPRVAPAGDTGRFGLQRSIVLSFKKAGDLLKAKTHVEAQLREFPTAKGLRIELAEVSARLEGSYERIPELLREELLVDPSVDADWRLSTILALGETQQNWASLKAEFRDQKQLSQSIEMLLREYWPTFGNLSGSSQEECLTAVWLRLFTPSSGQLGNAIRRNAALCSIRALEIEIRLRLFEPFRRVVVSDPGITSFANAKTRDPVLGIISVFVTSESKLSFGQMITSIKLSANNNDVLSSALYRYTRTHLATLLENVRQLEQLNRFRSPATHEAAQVSDPDEVRRICRRILERVARVPYSAAALAI